MKFLPKTVDSQFLVRVIRNEVGPEEREFFEKWIEESEENKEEYSSLLLLWDKFQYSHLPSIPPQQEQWERIESALNHPEHPDPESAEESFPNNFNELRNNNKRIPEKNFGKSSALWFYRMAAVIIIFLSFLLIYDSTRNENKSLVADEVKVPQASLKQYTIATEKGQKATLTLSDGSVIQLNSESKLIYPSYFGIDFREVEFEGEGYFKIHPDKNKPFKVKCKNNTIVVTGTEFNIRNRSNNFSVTVVEGSIKTFNGNSSDGISVRKGEMVFMNSAGRFSTPLKVNMEHLLAWRNNKFSFSKTPLSEAVEEIQRTYSNIKINILSDSIKHKTITGVFDTGSLDNILSIMSLTLDIKVNRKGNQIYFE